MVYKSVRVSGHIALLDCVLKNSNKHVMQLFILVFQN